MAGLRTACAPTARQAGATSGRLHIRSSQPMHLQDLSRCSRQALRGPNTARRCWQPDGGGSGSSGRASARATATATTCNAATTTSATATTMARAATPSAGPAPAPWRCCGHPTADAGCSSSVSIGGSCDRPRAASRICKQARQRSNGGTVRPPGMFNCSASSPAASEIGERLLKTNSACYAVAGGPAQRGSYMMLCDGSDGMECPCSYAGWHGHCLNHFVPTVPGGTRFCPRCAEAGEQAGEEPVEEQPVLVLAADLAEPLPAANSQRATPTADSQPRSAIGAKLKHGVQPTAAELSSTPLQAWWAARTRSPLVRIRSTVPSSIK